MTDEELIRLRKKIHAGQSLSRQETWKVLDAVTALRAQLAEANARADRAEADLQAMTLLKEKAEKALNALANQTNPDKER